jgi:hypothetical protein
MELIQLTCERDISTRNKDLSLENLALKNKKLFRIFKEQHDVIRTSCDQSKISLSHVAIEDTLE